MSEEPKKSEWFTPQVILAVLGMMGAIGGAWMSFDARISRVESDVQVSGSRFDRIENKLDQLLMQRGEK